MHLYKVSLPTPALSPALLVMIARQSVTIEVKRISKVATFAYLMHRHFSSKGPTTNHILKPQVSKDFSPDLSENVLCPYEARAYIGAAYV